MKVPLLNSRIFPKTGFLWRLIAHLTVWSVLCLHGNSLWAEGSKDFVTYDGYRMFLDTRDSQQLKVFAKVGETINVGSSHIGIQGGFINVYRPDGSHAATFDNTGASTGIGIINNNIQEMNGPNGGGTTLGAGYIPGTISVPAGQEGVWTVVFDYPSYQNTGFVNILNTATWTRAANQPNSRRVVLAWDITVTSGGAGNIMGSATHEGRVYSNEHISLLNSNNFTTSPIFYVLTKDGYLYEVNIKEADPFRFPISSNSLGLTTGNFNPIYKSKNELDFTRDDDPANWLSNNLYLYEPQAEDFGSLVNNKVFFNLPDDSMPNTAPVTDIFRNNLHDTWLYNEKEILVLDTFFLVGASSGIPCAVNTMAQGEGAYFVFVTNLDGFVTLELDLNNNGTSGDPEDLTLSGPLSAGTDSLFWDGLNGLGVPIPIQNNFTFDYSGTIRFGELHIALTDVENNPSGVTFKWLNPPTGYPDSLFYYDHSELGGAVSGGVAPGETPQPTTLPFTYSGNFGNDKYIDQWFFIEYSLSGSPFIVDVIPECTCQGIGPELTAVQSDDSYCVGENLNLAVTNSTATVGNLLYTWTGPNGFSFAETIGASATSSITLAVTNPNQSGTYQVIALSTNTCADTLGLPVTVNPLPIAAAIAGGGNVCAGDDLVLTTSNTVSGIASISYTWIGPNGFTASGTTSGNGTITATVPGITEAGEGNYTIVLTSGDGCISAPVSVSVTVNPTPILNVVSGGGNFCQGGNAILSANNTAAGVGSMTCTWTGPNGFFSQNTLSGTTTSSIELTNMSTSMAGVYTLICVNLGCDSAPLNFTVNVNALPEINSASPNDDFCVGSDVTLTAQNVTPGNGTLGYTWTGPNGFTFTGTAAWGGPFPATVNDITAAGAGDYTLVLQAAGTCQSVPQSVTVGVLPTPEVCNLTGGGDACIGQNVTLTAANCASGIAAFTYVLSNPQGVAIVQGGGSGNTPVSAVISNVQAGDSGNYTWTFTSSDNCVGAPASVNLNVVSGLNITAVTPDDTYCEGANVVLTATNSTASGNLTYTWTGPNNFSVTNTVASNQPMTATITGITVVQAGVYVLNVTSATGCLAGPINVNVGVDAGINITNVTGGGEYCEGADVNLSADGAGSGTGPVTYTWTGPGGFTFTGSAPPAGPFAVDIVNITAAQGGEYVLNITTANGCTDGPVSTFVAVFVKPIISGLPLDTFACSLDSFVLCATNSAIGIPTVDFSWVCANGETQNGTAQGDETFCTTFEPAGDYFDDACTLVLDNGGCLSDPFTVSVDISQTPVMSPINVGGPYCEGDVVTVTFWNTTPGIDSLYYTCAVGDTTYTSSAGGNDTITIQLVECGLIFCSFESYEGCVSDLVGAEIVCNPTPVAVVDVPTDICADEALTLTGTNGVPGTGTVSYTWTGPGGFTFTGTAPWAGPFNATDPTPVSGDYCLTLTFATCVSEIVCVPVDVNPVPEIQGAILGGGDLCGETSTDLTAIAFIADGSSMTYEWTLNGASIETGTVASGATVTLNATEDGEYCLTLTSDEGCVSEEVCTQVAFLPAPEILTVTGGGTFCQGVDVQLNGTGAAGLGVVNYSWTGPNFSFNGTANSAGPFPATITDIQPNQAGVYTLSVSLPGCPADTETLTIVVNPMPEITDPTGGGSFCPGDLTTISFTVDPNGAASVSYTLTGPNNVNQTGTVTTITDVTVVDIIVSETTAGTYTLEVTSNLGCEADPVSIDIEVIETVPVTLTANPGVLCEGETLTLTTNAQPGATVSYEWYLNGALIATTSVPTLVIDNASPGEYSVAGFVGGCSATSEPVTVTAPAAPTANDDTASTPAGTAVSGSVVGNDSPPTGVVFSLLSDPSNGSISFDENGNYTYTPDGGFSGTDQFTYQICLIDCPSICEPATVTITVIIDECAVPNVITPNGDGVNDELIIDCLTGEGFPDNRLRVFNRWGDEIFIAEPYDNSWDGTYGDDKKPLPSSTYFYLFQSDKNLDEYLSGYIKVVR